LTQADASSLVEKSRFERQQNALDQLAHLMERYDNRFSFETGSLAKGYIEGRLKFCLKLRSGGGGHEFHIIVSRYDIGRELQQRPWRGRLDKRFAFFEGRFHFFNRAAKILSVFVPDAIAHGCPPRHPSICPYIRHRPFGIAGRPARLPAPRSAFWPLPGHAAKEHPRASMVSAGRKR
jgi:hypothetical protein